MSHLTEGKTCEICAKPFTPKRSDAVCCNASCRKKKSRYRADAVKRLTMLAEAFNCTADELIDWYQNDLTDVARLPIADILFIVGDYIENHQAARRNDSDGDIQSAECYRLPPVSERKRFSGGYQEQVEITSPR